MADDRADGDGAERRILKIRIPARIALALEARRLLSGESKSQAVEAALHLYLAKQRIPDASGFTTMEPAVQSAVEA